MQILLDEQATIRLKRLIENNTSSLAEDKRNPDNVVQQALLDALLLFKSMRPIPTVTFTGLKSGFKKLKLKVIGYTDAGLAIMVADDFVCALSTTEYDNKTPIQTPRSHKITWQ